jgi:hypothetical protein
MGDLKVTHLWGAFLFGKASHEELVKKSNYLARQF